MVELKRILGVIFEQIFVYIDMVLISTVLKRQNLINIFQTNHKVQENDQVKLFNMEIPLILNLDLLLQKHSKVSNRHKLLIDSLCFSLRGVKENIGARIVIHLLMKINL